MIKWISNTLVAASLFAVVGCNGGMQDEPTGGPGADVPSDQDQEPQQEGQTFTPTLGQENMELAAGGQKEVTLSIDRGDQFDQTVTAQINPPEGLTADPEEVEMAAGQTEAKFTLQAAQDAPVDQELAVEIEFQPEQGQSVTKQLTVTINEQHQQSGGGS